MTSGRAAVWAWLAVIVPLWIVMVACTGWEPLQRDGWGNALWHRDHDVDWAAVWERVDDGWRYANPRLGQILTTLLYTPGPYHVIVTPLLELALFGLMTTLVLGRWPSPRRAGDALVFATLFAITAACTKELGGMLFYRPYTWNYVFGLAVNLLWLVPYRLHLASPRPGRGWGRSPLLLALGFLAGMCNEHTGTAFLALGGLAVAWSVRQGHGVRPWMIAGLVGLVAGYILLLLAPSHDLRYDGLAREAGILERILDRGVVENALVLGRLALYLPWALPWIALGVLARWIAPEPGAGSPSAREQRLTWAALTAAGVVAALTLLASPKIGPRLYFASIALIAIALTGWLLARSSSARLKLACALLSGAALIYVEVRCLVTYAQLGPAGAERLARLDRAPPGARVVVPRYPVARSKWFLGEDFRSPALRGRLAAYFGLSGIDLAPEP